MELSKNEAIMAGMCIMDLLKNSRERLTPEDTAVVEQASNLDVPDDFPSPGRDGTEFLVALLKRIIEETK